VASGFSRTFMAFNPGARLGPYEIHSALGAGGMGEVYRATDTKLGRAVALKILPDAFATDPDRVARFQREAKTLASLNHPNIGGIYGLEETGKKIGPNACAISAMRVWRFATRWRKPTQKKRAFPRHRPRGAHACDRRGNAKMSERRFASRLS